MKQSLTIAYVKLVSGMPSLDLEDMLSALVWCAKLFFMGTSPSSVEGAAVTRDFSSSPLSDPSATLNIKQTINHAWEKRDLKSQCTYDGHCPLFLSHRRRADEKLQMRS